MSQRSQLAFVAEKKPASRILTDGYLCGVCQHCSNLQSTVDDNLLLADYRRDIPDFFFEAHEYFISLWNNFSESRVWRMCNFRAKATNVASFKSLYRNESILFFFFSGQIIRPHSGTFFTLCGFFVRAALQSQTGHLKASFQSSEKVNKVNGGGAQHIPNKTRALYTARKPHHQVKELLQYLQNVNGVLGGHLTRLHPR